MEKLDQNASRFLEILFSHYLQIRKDTLKIDPKVLTVCGFNIEGDFFNITCPKLRRMGILRQYSQLRDPDDAIQDFQNFENYRYLLTFTVDSKKLEEQMQKEGEFMGSPKKYLKSLHLITSSLEPQNMIFLVLDENFDMPIRFAVKNRHRTPTYVKKLYDIAYFVDAPDKKVHYDKQLADRINNGLFRKRQVKKYMETNKLEKPTLVKKSEDKKTLVLKHEISVKDILIKNIPLQFQNLYRDKTQ